MAAARKEVVAEPEATPYNLGITSEDISPSRMRVVGKQADLIAILDNCKPGDIAIGQGSEDEDSEIVWSVKTGGPGVKFYVLKIHTNYACGFNGPKGSWEEGDPEMPDEAKRQYTYTLYIPSYDTMMPVLFTAGGTAAKEARKMNLALAKHCLVGAPYEKAFAMTSVVRTAGTNSWPGPVFKAAEPDATEVADAKAMHDNLVAPPQRQLAAASVDSEDTPGF